MIKSLLTGGRGEQVFGKICSLVPVLPLASAAEEDILTEECKMEKNVVVLDTCLWSAGKPRGFAEGDKEIPRYVAGT